MLIHNTIYRVFFDAVDSISIGTVVWFPHQNTKNRQMYKRKSTAVSILRIQTSWICIMMMDSMVLP